MSHKRISIVGTEGAGKTAFIGALAKALEGAGLPRISCPNARMQRYTTGIYDQLDSGNWPASTAVGTSQNLLWNWHSANGGTHEVRTFDCSGQDFRDIFEGRAELNDAQKTLREEFLASDLVLLLYNFSTVLDIHKVRAKNVQRVELSWAPADAVRQLREGGVTVHAIFTQADRYRERVENEWGGDFRTALRDVMPDLYFRLTRHGAFYAWVQAVETELRNGQLLPKIGCNPGNLENVVRAMDDFLNSNIVNMRQAEREQIAIAEEKERQKKMREAAERAAEAEARRNATIVTSIANIKMLPVAAGSFQMGGKESDEKPVHTVTISKPFWLGETPVTQAQWKTVMGDEPSHFKNAGENAPVECVSCERAMEFCKKLNEAERTAGRLPEGYVYALPTEAQWEYACRAGTTGDYAGNLEAMAWYEENSGGGTHAVAQKQPNAWGFYDMHGNVWEWCADWYDNYPTGSVTDPSGPRSGVLRVLRGGCWGSTAAYCRSARRDGGVPADRYNRGLGFRLALVEKEVAATAA
ncbi:MAG: SUMF1/EgtB/PvdO family nonheme iron enzyme [Puniceicoccales bacterium]|jgi:formylglycine-generating enzyme required for sulfatase activity|nr:SUMF1/EgtB/PvdO family nonheme iron enzyme [Puniceicoccales bacterium]